MVNANASQAYICKEGYAQGCQLENEKADETLMCDSHRQDHQIFWTLLYKPLKLPQSNMQLY